ncbi:MAG: THAP domain-containing protein [Gammaproteobacteria bacterium]|nr:THAP domain-containing protein [Gammaproteobacteria bacterium]
MPRCVALNCKSGYDSHPTPKTVTFHKFPWKNPDLLKRWEKNLHRADFALTKNSRICSLHFSEADFQPERTDTNACRKRSRGGLQTRRLKLAAEPNIFVHLPKYLHTTTPDGRSGRALSCKRRRLEEERHEEVVTEFLSSDILANVLELESRLKVEVVPSGFTLVSTGNVVILCYVALGPQNVPLLRSSITINGDMEYTVVFDGKPCSHTDFQDFSTKLDRFSHVVNLMALVKSWCENCDAIPKMNWLDMAAMCLKSFMDSSNIEEESDQVDLGRKIDFIREQLRLAQQPKNSRRYSPELIVYAYGMFAASSHGYAALLSQDVLSFPSQRRLRKVTNRVGHPNKVNNDEYLGKRAATLSEVSLIYCLF